MILGVMMLGLNVICDLPNSGMINYENSYFQTLRRVASLCEIPEKYRSVVRRLNAAHSHSRRVAIGRITEIIEQETDERIKDILALKVAEKLFDPDYYDVRRRAISALGEIVPLLTNEDVKREIALKLSEKLSDLSDIYGFIRKEALSVLTRIVHFLSEESKEVLALNVAEKLSHSSWKVRWGAVAALGEIIPLLTNEAVQEELCLRLSERLHDNSRFVYKKTVSVLSEKIIPSLTSRSIREELTLRLNEALSNTE